MPGHKRNGARTNRSNFRFTRAGASALGKGGLLPDVSAYFFQVLDARVCVLLHHRRFLLHRRFDGY